MFQRFFTAHAAGIVSLEVSCDGDVISDAVIFEYKNDPSRRPLESENTTGNIANETCDITNETSDITNETVNIANEIAVDIDTDEDSLSLVWECGNGVCNSYLCETETCRKTLRSTLLQRFEDLESKLWEQDSTNRENEKEVKHTKIKGRIDHFVFN